ncbi:hypothetical protein MRB53_023735 [Persea americana]|uniref:Uncharacterized protein n=1 Tax=Persea americana TaxID=3435 RepID=A0ACC2LAL3_PERAE|nr:hypothetical protein MRB53_023735 [Persea americana]
MELFEAETPLKADFTIFGCETLSSFLTSLIGIFESYLGLGAGVVAADPGCLIPSNRSQSPFIPLNRSISWSPIVSERHSGGTAELKIPFFCSHWRRNLL